MKIREVRWGQSVSEVDAIHLINGGKFSDQRFVAALLYWMRVRQWYRLPPRITKKIALAELFYIICDGQNVVVIFHIKFLAACNSAYFWNFECRLKFRQTYIRLERFEIPFDSGLVNFRNLLFLLVEFRPVLDNDLQTPLSKRADSKIF